MSKAPNVASRSVELAGTRVTYAAGTDAGCVRSINQDTFFVDVVPRQGIFAVVADGMGGHKDGEVASQTAVAKLVYDLERDRQHPPVALAKAVKAAHYEICDYIANHPETPSMGTTLTSICIDDQVALLGHVGDSRAYLVRDGRIKQLTRDHSWVADRVRQGVLTEDEARHHQWRNLITNAVGAVPELRLDLSFLILQDDDRILLCSDGVSTLLSDQEMMRTSTVYHPEEAVKQILIQANERGSPDNITMVLLHVESVSEKAKRYNVPELVDEDNVSSITINNTVNLAKIVEDLYPAQDTLSRLQHQPWFPYRYWLLACFLLLLLFLVFSLIQ